MMDIEDRVTIGERYAQATESSNLRAGEKMGDPYYLIAAAQLEETLGALLFRLSTEYDAVRGEHQLADAAYRQRTARADEEASSVKVGPTRERELRDIAAAAAMTERALILSRLKTLRETKEALGSFASLLATRRKYMRPDAAVMLTAGQALQVFLDPLCSHCAGRGFNGGSHRGEPRIRCRPCRETGHRKASIGKDELSRQFGAALLVEMERMLATAAGGIARTARDIGKALRDESPAGTIGPSST